MTHLRIRPCELKDANTFIEKHHRHHKKVVGHRFSIAVVDERGNIVGVCVVGRPVARLTPKDRVLEVTRLATDGTKNACSALYAAAARVGANLGYHKIQTFILETETGKSLVASDWKQEGLSPGGQWKHTDGKPRRTDQPVCAKQRWSKVLNPDW